MRNHKGGKLFPLSKKIQFTGGVPFEDVVSTRVTFIGVGGVEYHSSTVAGVGPCSISTLAAAQNTLFA